MPDSTPDPSTNTRGNDPLTPEEGNAIRDALDRLQASFGTLSGPQIVAEVGDSGLGPQLLRSVQFASELLGPIHNRLEGHFGEKLAPSDVPTMIGPALQRLIGSEVPPKIVTACTGAAADAAYLFTSQPGASRIFLNGHCPYAVEESKRFLGGRELGSSVSEGVAIGLAQSSFMEALQCCLGSKDDVHRSPLILGASVTAAVATNRERRGDDHIQGAIRTLEGLYTYHVTFDKGCGLEDRNWQGALSSLLVVNSVLAASGMEQVPILDTRLHSDQLVENPDGPGRVLSLKSYEPPKLHGEGPFFIKLDGSLGTNEEMLEFLQGGAAIYPGSYNPLHHGHDLAADNAQNAIDKKVVFEITDKNADKDSVGYDGLRERLFQFVGRWPVILRSDAGLFRDKMAAYPGVNDFVVGYDTAVRILSPEYYEGRFEEIDRDLRSYDSQGAQFHVLGRHDKSSGRFMTANSLWLPQAHHGLFQPLIGQADIDSTTLRNLMESAKTTKTR